MGMNRFRVVAPDGQIFDGRAHKGRNRFAIVYRLDAQTAMDRNARMIEAARRSRAWHKLRAAMAVQSERMAANLGPADHLLAKAEYRRLRLAAGRAESEEEYLGFRAKRLAAQISAKVKRGEFDKWRCWHTWFASPEQAMAAARQLVAAGHNDVKIIEGTKIHGDQ